jgi:hypothetical protein
MLRTILDYSEHMNGGDMTRLIVPVLHVDPVQYTGDAEKQLITSCIGAALVKQMESMVDIVSFIKNYFFRSRRW